MDFKAAYDTIIRNKGYVGMSELNEINTLYQNHAHYQNTKRLFRTLQNPTKIKTGRRIIYADAFQCRAGSYCTTSKPTNNRHNL
jgi:hypothetical protein